MNTTALLIGLGPLLGWGLYPTIVSKIGGKPVNQILGSTLGTLIFALVFSISQGIHLASGMDLFLGILSGIGWAAGQIVTFYCFSLIGSSKVMPITTAFQLLAASLWGVVALGNWPGVSAKILGAFSLILIIFGASLTVWSEEKTPASTGLLRKVVIFLALGAIGYWAYSAAPQASNLSGQEAFLPQAIGMLLTALIYSIVISFKEKSKMAIFESVSYKHIISGFFFAFAALTYLISAQPDMNGLATGFILSQTSVVLATLTGIWFLNQRKTKKEMLLTIIGLVLIIIAASITVTI
ncbi:ribose/proton symporter RbsU [Lactococcus petauri]|uniref:ribose/proton symporter RbsU n=1 Tax=Lactococcus petauri TaxID=1940789 RepID=UPI00254CC2F4|nr:GRP family sugar transporter [Lactococcus petauri]